MSLQHIPIKIPDKRIIFITAPSGTGKTTLICNIIKTHANFCLCVSHTSRSPREGEIFGQDYYFISSSEFEIMIAEKKFLEWVNLSGIFYGTSWKEIENRISQKKIIILDIDVQGALYWMRFYKSGLFIFLSPPSIEILEKRLRKRKTETEDLIKERLMRSQKELLYRTHWNHIIINETVENSLLEFETLIQEWVN